MRPHLTEENHREVLESARHLGKRAIEEIVARLHARSDVRALVRKLPAPRSQVVADRRVSTALDDHEVGALGQPTLLVAGTADEVGSASSDRGSVPIDRVTAAQPVGPRLLSDTEVRDLPSQPPAAPRPAVVRPLAPARYQVQMTVSAETHAKLRQAQDLLRHVVPNGDPAAIFDRALTLLVQDLLRKKCAARKKPFLEPLPDGRMKRRRRAAATHVPRPGHSDDVCAAAMPPPCPDCDDRQSVPATHKGSPPITGDDCGRSRRSRHISAAVKRAVWERDGAQCAFVGDAGRCPERGFLEYHHKMPFAAGGESSVANVSLRCRHHNAHEAERFFGPDVAARRAPQLGPDRVERVDGAD